MKKLCLRCMHELDGKGKCPNCHFDINNYKPKVYYLPAKTILAGKYLVGCVLGEGGFGITYIGWDLSLDLMVAIKEYYPFGFAARDSSKTLRVEKIPSGDNGFFDRGREKFKDEAQKLAKFYGDPGIVSVMATFQENDTAYIVMEYIQGIHLAEFTAHNGGKLSIDTTLNLLRLPMQALSQLHERDMLHRDISPENLMVTQKNIVKLIDFGSAGAAASDQKTRNLAVRPGYSPFELYYMEGKEGPFSDEYSLCATIYKTITGVTPPDAPSRIKKDGIKRPSELGVKIEPDQEKALMKGLSVNSQDRYKTISELSDALASKKKTVKKKPRKLFAAAAILVCLSLLLVVGFIGFKHSRTFGAIEFTSADFESRLRAALNVDAGEDITRDDLKEITKLSVGAEGVYFDDVETASCEPHWGGLSLKDVGNFPNLVYLSVTSADVNDIVALASMSHLRSLILSDCSLTDISDLSGLSGLAYIDVSENPIDDISPLSGLPLNSLDISGTNVVSLVPLAEMDSLTSLSVDRCHVSDISPLSGLDGLTALYAGDTDVTDWSCISQNVKIYGVWTELSSREFASALAEALGKNPEDTLTKKDIANIDTLVINNGAVGFIWPETQSNAAEIGFDIDAADFSLFPSLTRLYIAGHAIVSPERFSDIENLISLSLINCGISDISFTASCENLENLVLNDNSVSDLKPLAGTKLNYLSVSGNPVTSLAPLFVMKALNTLDISGCGVMDISPLADIGTLENLYADMNSISDWTPAANVKNVVGKERQKLVFKSVGFAGMLREALGKAAYDELLSGDIEQIESLTIAFDFIKLDAYVGKIVADAYEVSYDDNYGDIYLSDVSMFPNLKHLYILNRKVIDTDELSALTGLTDLRLLNCGLTDCEFVSPLKNLSELYLDDNDISSIEPINDLSLREFSMDNSFIVSKISLKSNDNLEYLSLRNCGINDISFLSGFTAIKTLCLDGNGISDIEQLRGMDIEFLSVSDNPIQSLEPLTGMLSIDTLIISGCGISDISPLYGLTSLKTLYAKNNSISDWRPVENVENINGKDEQAVKFESPEFEKMLRTALDKGDAEISTGDISNIENITIIDGVMSFTWPDTNYTPSDSITEVDIADIKWFAGLKHLYIANHKVKSFDVLGNMSAFSTIAFNNCGIEDCAFLKPFADAGCWIYLNDNQVTDISPLCGANTVRLGVSGNPISSLEPLAICGELKYFAANDCLITDISPLGGLTKLERLLLSGNSIIDWSFVDNVKDVTGVDTQIIRFTSPDFESMLRAALGTPEGETVKSGDIAKISTISISDGIMTFSPPETLPGITERISELSAADLRNFPALVNVYISNYELLDTQTFANLNELNTLSLRNCGVSDCGAFSGMTKLQLLYLYGNSITDLSALSGLPITSLEISANPVETIEPLASLNQLTSLYAGNCQISDISPLRDLSGLTYVYLGNNPITDWSPVDHVETVSGNENIALEFKSGDFKAMVLKALGKSESDDVIKSDLADIRTVSVVNGVMTFTWPENVDETGDKQGSLSLADLALFPELRNLYVANMSVTDYVSLADKANLEFLHLPNCGLTECGFVGSLKALSSLKLSNNGISELNALSGLNLRYLNISNNPVSSLEPLSGMPALETLVATDCGISDISPLANIASLKTVCLNRNYVTDWSPVSNVAEIQGADEQYAAFDSSEFTAMFNKALGRAADDAVYTGDIEKVTTLSIVNGEISFEVSGNVQTPEDLYFGIHVSDLRKFTNLNRLFIAGHSIMNLDELSNLTGLTYLYLNKCGITDCNFAASLTELKSLYIYYCDIGNIEPLANLGLTSFGINFYKGSIEPLAGLNSLEWLFVADSEITDVSPLAPLTNLRYLCIAANHISNLEPLRNMNLETLNISNNSTETLEPLSGMIGLTSLSIENCGITDLSPLSNLTALTEVKLKGNYITDFSPVSHVENVIGMDEQQTLSFKSPEFEAMLRAALNKAEGESIFPDDIGGIDVMVIKGGVMSFVSPDDHTEPDEECCGIYASDLLMFKNLKWLYIFKHTILDYEELSNLTNLTKLYLKGSAIPDCGFVSSLTGLKELYMYNCGISDIEPIAKLNIDGFGMSGYIGSLEPLTGLTDIFWLKLRNCGITDISPLSALTALKTLYIPYNSIADLEALRGMNIEILEISYNPINSLEPLADMDTLEELWAYGLDATDFSYVEHVTQVNKD